MMTKNTVNVRRTASAELVNRVLDVLSNASQPLTGEEIKRAMLTQFNRMYHITSVFNALLVLVDGGKVSSREESVDERNIRLGGNSGRRRARLFSAGDHVGLRTSRSVTINGRELPERVIAKPTSKSRPAYTKKVQTGQPLAKSRPAKDPDVQTDLLYQVDKLSARVEELEMTLEMMRRLLRLAEKF